MEQKLIKLDFAQDKDTINKINQELSYLKLDENSNIYQLINGIMDNKCAPTTLIWDAHFDYMNFQLDWWMDKNESLKSRTPTIHGFIQKAMNVYHTTLLQETQQQIKDLNKKVKSKER